MEFPFNIGILLGEEITIINQKKMESVRNSNTEKLLAEVVDKMGSASSHAQGLRAPITTYLKMKYNSEVVYILKGMGESEKEVVIGMIKTGHRKLFLNDSCGKHHKVEPLCVLDFYVHESKQRGGYGKKLFEIMLQSEGMKVYEIAIDRPSSSFLHFLKKHYGLTSYINQANHYVVFDKFFTTCQDLSHRPKKKATSIHSSDLRTNRSVRTKLAEVQVPAAQPIQVQPAPAVAVRDNISDESLKPALENSGKSHLMGEVATGISPAVSNEDGQKNSTKNANTINSLLGQSQDKFSSMIDHVKTTVPSNLGKGSGCIISSSRMPTNRGTTTVSVDNKLGNKSDSFSNAAAPKAAAHSFGSRRPGLNLLGLGTLATKGSGVTNAVASNTKTAGLGSSHFGTGIFNNTAGSGECGDRSLGAGSASNDIAPFLNMRQTRYGRKRSDLFSCGTLGNPQSASTVTGYSRYVTGDRLNRTLEGKSVLSLQGQQASRLNLSSTKYTSSQAKLKDSWKQFIK